MTTPRVTELPLRLEAVDGDSFIDDPAAIADGSKRRRPQGGPCGGIRTGDRFPDQDKPWKRSGALDSHRYPPYVTWQGDLPEDGDSSQTHQDRNQPCSPFSS
jgi:hypothetical protein